MIKNRILLNLYRNLNPLVCFFIMTFLGVWCSFLLLSRTLGWVLGLIFCICPLRSVVLIVLHLWQVEQGVAADRGLTSRRLALSKDKKGLAGAYRQRLQLFLQVRQKCRRQ